MPDGTVIIETKLDDSGLKAGLQRAKQLAQSAGQSVEKALNSAAKSGADSAGDTAKQAAKGLETMGKSAEKATEGLGQLPGAADAAADAAGGLGSQISSLASSFGLTLSAAGLLKTGITELIEVAKSARNAYTEFESAFTGVAKTVDATPDQMEKIKQGIKDMSNEVPSSVKEIASVAEAAGQLGVLPDNILDFTRVMIDLGNSTNLSATDAATALARLNNILGVNNNEVRKEGSAVVALGNNFATTESEILNTATRLASTGAVIGLTVQDVLALATALSSVGIEAEAGGTAVSKIFKDMQRAVSNNGGALKDYAEAAGMSTSSFKELWEASPMDAFQTLVDGMAATSDAGGDLIKVLDDLGLTDVRTSNTILALTKAHKLLYDAKKMSNDAFEEGNDLTEEAEKRYATTESQEQIYENNKERALAAWGEGVERAQKPWRDFFNGIFDTFADFNEGWDYEALERAKEENKKNFKDFWTGRGPMSERIKSNNFVSEKAGFWQNLRDEIMNEAREQAAINLSVPIELEPVINPATMQTKLIEAAEGLQDKLMADLGYTGQRWNSEKGEMEYYDDSDKWMQKVAQNAGQMNYAFGELNTGSQDTVKTFDEMLNTMQQNSAAMQDWGDNMLDLNTRLGQFDGGDIILEQLKNMGIEGSQQVAAMVAMTDEQLKQLADQAAYSAQIAFTVTMEVEGADAAMVELDKQIGAIQSQINDYSKLFESGLISEEQFSELTAPLEEQLQKLTDAAGLTSSSVIEEMDEAKAAAEGKVGEFEGIGGEIIQNLAAGVSANGGILSDVLQQAIQDAISAAALAAGGKENPGPEGSGETGKKVYAGGMPSTIVTDSNGGAVPQGAGGDTTIYNFNVPVYSPGVAAEAEHNATTERGYTDYPAAAY